MRVAVLSGGRSSEHEVSLASGAGVREGLVAAGHDVVDVRIARDGTWALGDGTAVVLEPGRGLLGCDVCFPVLHGPFGEDGTVQGLLECLGVAYVGADVACSALCMDKVRFKDLMGTAAVAQVRYAALRSAQPGALDAARALGFPQFVKPARLGSSVGISKVREEAELRPAVELALRHDPLVIAEASAPDGALEVECSVLGDADTGDVAVSVPGEIVLPDADWYDFEAKYSAGGMELVVPARISDAATRRVADLARAAFARSGCSGLARADFFVAGDDVLLNELNTMPGQTPTSVYAKLWQASGRAYEAVLEELCAIAVARHERAAGYAF